MKANREIFFSHLRHSALPPPFSNLFLGPLLLPATLRCRAKAIVVLKMAAAQDEGVLSQFDFSAIEDMDPSLSGGHRVIYDREVPFELRVQQVSEVPQEVGTLEAVRVKILIIGDDSAPVSMGRRVAVARTHRAT